MMGLVKVRAIKPPQRPPALRSTPTRLGLAGLVLSVLPGCVLGAGPVIGVGEHRGLFFGGEGIAGSSAAQGAAGWTASPGGEGTVRYVRIDLVGGEYDKCGTPSDDTMGYRVGVGLANAEHDTGGSVAVATEGFDATGVSRRRAGVVMLQVRYARGWQILLGARVEQHKPEESFCGGFDNGGMPLPPSEGGGVK
jgi:hypothetical protein